MYTAGSDVFLVVSDLIMENRNLFLSLLHADVSHGIFAIKDPGDLFEGGAFGLDEDEVDPNRFNDIPKLQTQCVLEDRCHETSEVFRKVELTV
jgi:hypothetical protein